VATVARPQGRAQSHAQPPLCGRAADGRADRRGAAANLPRAS